MKTPIKTTLAFVLPLASLLWMAPPASAHDNYYRHRHSWSESYRHPYTGRYGRWQRPQSYGSTWGYGKNRWKYDKAMNRLARQEREARAKAYRRYEGNGNDWRYRRRLAEIDRKYDHKRGKVERNWGGYRR